MEIWSSRKPATCRPLRLDSPSLVLFFDWLRWPFFACSRSTRCVVASFSASLTRSCVAGCLRSRLQRHCSSAGALGGGAGKAVPLNV